MADKTPEKETEETEETKKPAGLVVPLIIVIVLMPIVAYLTTEYFLVKKLAESIAKQLDGVEYVGIIEKEEDKNKREPKIGDDGEEIDPIDEFLMERQQVNVKNTNGSRSLWVSILIEGKEKGGLGDKIEESEKYKAYFREETNNIIGQFELTEMDSSATRAKVKAQMIIAFNNILEDDDAVKNVVIESWSVQ
jgi:flagellar basal body-associated protein FliL